MVRFPSIILIVSLSITGCGGGSSQADSGQNPPEQDYQSAMSISQFGITWDFAEEAEYGQFANGDYWVVGPVSISRITPASVETMGITTGYEFTPSTSGDAEPRTMHGSMLNPSPRSNTTQGYESETTQGYDSETYAWHSNPETGKRYPTNYGASLNVALGVSDDNRLQLPAGSSLVSSISHEQGERPQIKTHAVLTVLDFAPAEGSFRPPYSGSNKTVGFNKDQLNYSLLQRITPVASVLDISTVSDYFEKPWIDHVPNFGARYIHASDNMPDYGREISTDIGEAALMLHLDYSDMEKEELLIRFVQLGIDFYGITQDGGENNWLPNGGHESGRKWPIMFAGLMLGDTDMANIGFTDVQFGEDGQTFYVDQEVVDRNYEEDCGGYASEQIGMPEYGIRHSYNPKADNALWSESAYRRCCTANAWGGFVLAAHIMDQQANWNHDALFDYQDRYMSTEQENYYRQTSTFVEDMWDTYRGGY